MTETCDAYWVNPFDYEDYYACDLPAGHGGNHQRLQEWADTDEGAGRG